jgi:hypothetical protein
LPSLSRAEKEIGKRTHIKLFWDHFSNLMKARVAQDGLIVATNIVECGANLKELTGYMTPAIKWFPLVTLTQEM